MADALSDGILIRRYLQYYQYSADSHWKGPDLVQDALVPNDPSPTPGWQDIWNFLDTFLPTLPVPAAGSGLLAANTSADAATEPSAQAAAAQPAGDDACSGALLAAQSEQIQPLAASASDTVDRQVVTPDPVAQTVDPGSPVTIHVNYTTDPQDTTLTGLGLRMYYNSQVLTLQNLSDILGTSFVQQSPPMDDTANSDNDATTDKYILIAWADLSGNWPNTATAQLFTANLTSSATATGSTSVNFTSSSTASGWTFDSTSAVVNFVQANDARNGTLSGYVYIDANGNGKYDANEGLPNVTMTLGGPIQATATTNDDGYYEFTNLPAGAYVITEKQPAACLDCDGPDQAGTIDGKTVGTANNPGDSITGIALPASKSGVNYQFTETSLNPLFIPNRLLATTTQPVGSTVWRQVIRNTMVSAEQQVSHTSVASAAVTYHASSVSVASSQAAHLTAQSSAVHVAAQSSSAARPSASVQVSASQPAPAAAPEATPEAAPLTSDALAPIVNEAIARWAKAGLSAASLDALRNVQVSIADLSGSYLGLTENGSVFIDRDAAGYGWFVDPTPDQDEEFQPTAASGQLQAVDARAVDHMDLLTVVEHELGHAAGLGDLDPSLEDLMSSSLSKGIRREVSPSDVDAVLAGESGIN